MKQIDPKMFYKALINPRWWIDEGHKNDFWWVSENKKWMFMSTNYTDEEWPKVLKENEWQGVASGTWRLDIDFLAAVKPYVVKNV
jgi:hypothetical protein